MSALRVERRIRDDVSRYESIALSLVEMHGHGRGSPVEGFPPADSPLGLATFFDMLYLRYDERYVTSAPDLAGVTRRLEWDPALPAMQAATADYPVRTAD